MTNDYYSHSGWPVARSKVASLDARTELADIETGFDKLPTLSGNGDKMLFVNSGATALDVFTAASAKEEMDAEVGVDIQAYDAELTAISNISWPTWATGIYAAIAVFNGTSTATYSKIESNNLLGNAGNTASQRAIKEKVESEQSTRLGKLEAATGVGAYFMDSAPTGWTISSAVDNRLVFVHATNGGTTVGTVSVVSDWDTGIESIDNHTHTMSVTADVDANTSTRTAGTGSTDKPEGDHVHSLTLSGTSDARSQSHKHTISAPKARYFIMATKS